MIDLHAHLIHTNEKKLLRDEIAFRRAAGIFTCFSAGSPAELELLKDICPPGTALHGTEMISFGIHPWNAADWNPSKYSDLYQETALIGEIGLDTLWCDVPYETQLRCFLQQLEIAAKLKKPVILHTKNCEEEIADLIADFPEPVCVHWYSGSIQTLRRFLSKGCYFTFAPNAQLLYASFNESDPDLRNPAVPDFWNTAASDQQHQIVRDPLWSAMAAEVPADRVFTETDGLDAVLWVLSNNEEAPPVTEESLPDLLPLLPASLTASLQFLADAHARSIESMQAQIFQNLETFLYPRSLES